MPKLKLMDFYYGAILSALFRYNKDASPVLISNDDKKQIYKMMTNTSQECRLYFKYASQKILEMETMQVIYLHLQRKIRNN